MLQSPDTDQDSGGRDSWQSAARFALLEVFFIFVVFFVHAGFPTPDDSEAHYLAIAKHAWNPEWIPNDLLLNSTNVHVVFSTALGWISRFAPLSVFAWSGRVITWLLLAWGWRRLAVAITPQRLFAVLSAALFVTFCQYFNMSREWAVGGMEAKALSYAFVLFGLERIVRNHWNQALALLGIATSVHVVVGGWATLAAGVCWLFGKAERPPLLTLLPGLFAALLLAQPGLLPALRLLSTADPADAAIANKVYVFYRLPHHLWPPQMEWWHIARHFALIVFAVMAFRYVVGLLKTSSSAADEEPQMAQDPANHGLASDETLTAHNKNVNEETTLRLRRLLLMTLAAVGFCTVGLVFAFACFWTRSLQWIDDATVASVMKFYWFRLSDVLVPTAAALFATHGIMLSLARDSKWGRGALVAALAIVTAHLGFLALHHQAVTVPRADSRSMITNFADWRSICRDATALPGANGPARFITPWNAVTFKWYSSRSDVVCLKDIPQDAASIVKWWETMKDIYLERSETGFAPRGSFTEYPVAELLQFSRDYDADYLITESTPEIPGLPRVAVNRSYAIYQLRAVPSSSGAAPGSTSENAPGK